MSDQESKNFPPRRPKIATKEHILGLLRARILAKDTPTKVLGAMFSLLHKKGFFTIQASGHIDIFDDPQATLKEPSEAARALFFAFGRFRKTFSDEEVCLLEHIVQFPVTDRYASNNPRPPSIATDSRTHPPNRLKDLENEYREAEFSIEKSKNKLNQLRWYEDSHIDAFGKDAKAEASIIMKYIIKQTQTEVEGARGRKAKAQEKAENQAQASSESLAQRGGTEKVAPVESTPKPCKNASQDWSKRIITLRSLYKVCKEKTGIEPPSWKKRKWKDALKLSPAKEAPKQKKNGPRYQSLYEVGEILKVYENRFGKTNLSSEDFKDASEAPDYIPLWEKTSS